MEDNRKYNAKTRAAGPGFWLGTVLSVVLTVGMLFLGGVFQPERDTVAELAALRAQAAEVEQADVDLEEISITELLKTMLAMKSELKEAAKDIADGNLELSRLKFLNVTKKTATVRTGLDATIQAMGDSIPGLTDELVNAQTLLDIVDLAVSRLVQPFIRQLSDHPVDNLIIEDGIRVSVLYDYLDFAETLMPDIREIAALADGADLSLVDSDGDLAGYLEALNNLLAIYQADPTVLSMMKDVLGANGDRFYVLPAQNTAEIRASGGFPGAVGTVSICDGVLTLGDFKKVYDLFNSNTPLEANVTAVENRLFRSGMIAPRDAGFCPDFERVGYIWALGYESRMGTAVDGVISMTPAIVQKFLAATGEEITLFDGMVLNGENAARGLQHDLYYNYWGGTYTNNPGVVTDQLFADAAKKTMQRLMENLDAESILAYLNIALECFENRTLMIWSKDPAEQALIRKLGWDGGLNSDPENPVAGIYFNCTNPSKMGWFLIADIQVGQAQKNENGSCTYPITVTFSNDMTKDEIIHAQSYITGGSNGTFLGNAYLFAPAGGSVGSFTSSSGIYFQTDNYHDLDLGFVNAFSVNPNQEVTISYTVTTAPGVDTPLKISQTPTLQEYH